MKILFHNLIDDATLTGEHTSFNYPPENWQSTSIYKRVQSSLHYDTVTIVFENYDATISDFWYAFTNATLIIIRLYDYENGLIYEHRIDEPEEDIGHIWFTPIEDVDSMEIYYEGPLGVYLGGIGVGQAYVMPDPEAAWAETDEDNSIVSESPYGQTNQDYVRPLRSYPFRFPDLSRNEMNEMQELIRRVGRGRPLWIDPFDLNHDFMKPLYGKITNALKADKNGRTYYFTLEIKEAR